MIDINNPDDIEALRRACAMPAHERESRWFYGNARELDAEGAALRRALGVLREPSTSAALTRDLLARAGMHGVRVYDTRMNGQDYGPFVNISWTTSDASSETWHGRSIRMTDVPALIRALLDARTVDDAKTVLREARR